ncbi:hypothetical protein LTS18_008521 [Coniosporium uncinatum]|uniref:Uncharacterized protein n=1 Tax=Coniosporium uncinatum TaxID=93489 RepID=A0ACC3DNI4_9PEZI|nr:hypothetical protein LTS18_008521 [Coniosporium uncinatum]
MEFNPIWPAWAVPGIPGIRPAFQIHGPPIDVDPIHGGWQRGGVRLPGHKPKWAMVWPRDGKNGSYMGRWKDIITGKGPDMYVGSHRGRGYGWDKPSRGQWSKWANNPAYPGIPLEAWERNTRTTSMPWAQRSSERPYDFLRREYAKPKPYTWTDARWPDEPNGQYKQPAAYRCGHGDWFGINHAWQGGAPLQGWVFPQGAQGH